MQALQSLVAQYPKSVKVGNGSAEIRVMSQADREAVIAFARSLPEQDLLFLRIDITEADNVNAWVANLESGQAFSLVAYADDVMVGYATVEQHVARWTRRVGEIRINVSASHRSRGLGRSLTSQIFDAARAMGLKKLVAHMTPDQSGAQAAFGRLGFVPEALLADHVEDRAGNLHDLVIMSLDMDGHSSHVAEPLRL